MIRPRRLPRCVAELVALLMAVTLLMAMWPIGAAQARPTPRGVTCSVGLWCGQVYHRYVAGRVDPPITVRQWKAKRTHQVQEGQSSKRYLKDADEVYVATGWELWCRYAVLGSDPVRYVWIKPKDANGLTFDKTGWHKIRDNFNDGSGCAWRRD